MAVGRCPFPHARIAEIDVEEASRLPGVHQVLVGREVVERTEPIIVLRPVPGAPDLPYYALAGRGLRLRGAAGRQRRRRQPGDRRGRGRARRDRLRAPSPRLRHARRAGAGGAADPPPTHRLEPPRIQSPGPRGRRGRAGGRRRRRRGQLPDRPGDRAADGGARDRRRVAPGRPAAHRAHLDPGAAPRAHAAGGVAAPRRRRRAGGDRRCRWRLRPQARHLPRGRARLPARDRSAPARQWTEDRVEHFRATTHGRESVHECGIGAAPDGADPGDDRSLHDRPRGAELPFGSAQLSSVVFTGPYGRGGGGRAPGRAHQQDSDRRLPRLRAARGRTSPASC